MHEIKPKQNIAEKALEKLNLNINLILKLKYHGKFNAYNANVRKTHNTLTFNLSKNWRKIDKDIQIGLIQELAFKILKIKHKKTMNTDLYNIFLKKVHISIPKTKTDSILAYSFNKMNEEFFNHQIEIPNLQWGSYSTTKLGSYEYGSDTISISKILEGQTKLLDYVMYHEMLHKKHKFYNKNGRSFHHTATFRNEERAFPNQELMERQLTQLCNKYRMNNNSFFKKVKLSFFQ